VRIYQQIILQRTIVSYYRQKKNSFVFRNDAETSLRLRQERLKRNEALEKRVNEMKAKLSAPNKQSILTLLMTKYRRPFYIGLFTIFTGSIFFYKFITSNDRTR
jgi:hypothetical protein